MAIFDYLTPSEALYMAGDTAPDHLRITGLRAVDADRIPNMVTRTRAGYGRKPEYPWQAHAHLDKFEVIARIERAKDADPGVIEIFWTDGSSAFLHPKDLLCVERPITSARVQSADRSNDSREDTP